MIKLAAQVVPLKANAEKEAKDLAKKYGVSGYPTIVFVDSNGEAVGRIGGYLPPDAFSTELTKITSAYKQMPEIEAALKKDPNDGPANAKMAGILAGRGQISKALAAVKRAKKAGVSDSELASTYNAIGDSYQNDSKYDAAIRNFKKADIEGNSAEIRSYAKISIATCHASNKDMKAAKKVAQELIDMEDATPAYVEAAKQILKR